MQRKRSVHIPKGMTKDISNSKIGSEYYIDALNIRLTAQDDNTLLSITNAKGNQKVKLGLEDDRHLLCGTFLGHAILNNYIVLFTSQGVYDYIYRIDTADSYKVVLLAAGDFNFDGNFPIETLSIYEKEDVQKVYWVDGKNPPRFINIVTEIVDGQVVPRTWATKNSPSTAFDFVATINLQEQITITRNETSLGTISAGVIQYALTYYNLHGQESNIFHQSSLYYISYNNRGASPEDTNVSVSFTINLQQLDTSFNYVRIYSIHRTSLNATPTVRRVVDLPVSSKALSYVDDGRGGEIVDPTLLLFIGGKTVIPQTLTHKDNTLFFGNFQEKESLVPDEIKKLCTETAVNYTNTISKKVQKMSNPSEYYSYYSGLTKSLKEISTFKYLEYYRFGIQAQKATGEWSEPIFMEDVQNEKYIEYDNNGDAKLIGARATLSETLTTKFKEAGYVRVRPMVVYPTLTDRECICQGVVNPTVFNVEDRATNSPWCQSSWFFRPNAPKDMNKTEGGQASIANSYTTVYCIPVYKLGDNIGQLKVGDKVDVEHEDSQSRGSTIMPSTTFTVVGVVRNLYESGTQPAGYGLILLKPVNEASWSWSAFDSEYRQLEPTQTLSIYFTGSGFSVGSSLVFADDGTLGMTQRQILTEVLPPTGASAELSWKEASEYIWNEDYYLFQPSPDRKYMRRGSPTNTYTFTVSIKAPTISTGTTVVGTIPEFRHWNVLPSARKRNGEIQCNYASEDNNLADSKVTADCKIGTKTLSQTEFIDQCSDMFFVDQSIVTFHSPDLEFDTTTRSIDSSSLKMRIVGYVPITGTISDIDIQTSTLQLNYRNTDALPRGFWHETVGATGQNGVNSLNAAAMWYDEEYHGDNNPPGENTAQFTTAFMVYPWHRNGSLNNQSSKNSENYRSAMLKRKVMSNLRFSYKSIFENQSGWAILDKAGTYNLSGISLFDANEVINTRISSDGDVEHPTINYYGNVDKVVSSSRVFNIDGTQKATGYPIFKTTRFKAGDGLQSYHNAYVSSNVMPLTDHVGQDVGNIKPQQKYGSDPVSIKYKSTPHAVLGLADNKILPTAYNNEQPASPLNKADALGGNPFWSSEAKTFTQKVVDCKMEYGWLWLVELYNDNVQNRFGGTSDEAIKNNTWVPCGQPVTLGSETTRIDWTEGDTFYQRYDCLKTYPFTQEDTNSVVDILSFMVETRVNIDGRYDRNRGQHSNLYVSPINFNLLNHIYSQPNNFFNYRPLDKRMFNVDTYKNYITWSKQKTYGEEVDTWTNVTLANVMDLDGDKGSITALRRFNNNIVAFQEKGISQILYNEKTQLSTTVGVPVEIANSGKVEGKRYISETIGCTNKWSIAESPYGLYFIDSNNASINLFNGQITDLTSKFGFSSWAKCNIRQGSWTSAYNTFRTFYDSKNRDVYFVNNKLALNFSESLNQFTSFISYGNALAMFNVGNKFYAFHNEDLYEQDAGAYGQFFGECKPYSITFVDNQDYALDKTYSNIEFRAVVYPDMNNNQFNLPFDRLTATTDYQEGTTTFTPQQGRGNMYHRYPNLVRKFRTWRADIPRNYYTQGTIARQDRMRNPWIYLKLEKDATGRSQNKMELHDLIVDYYI